MKPLIAIDADVLGRRRTGDETYVAALLRELVPIADEERLVAAHTAPGARPGRDRGARASGEKPGDPHAVRSTARAAAVTPVARVTSSTSCRRPTAGLPSSPSRTSRSNGIQA